MTVESDCCAYLRFFKPRSVVERRYDLSIYAAYTELTTLYPQRLVRYNPT